MPATTVCRNWFAPEEFTHLRCVSQFEPDDGNPSCPICVGPQLLYGQCGDCPSPPPLVYAVTINIDGNGIAAGNPDRGCGASAYSGEFLLYYGPTNCIWSSKEKELRTWSPPGSGLNPVICEAITGLNVRSRVTMQVLNVTVTGTPRTVYAVTANWYGAIAGYIPSLAASSVTARGVATKLDCYEAVTNASYYSRKIVNVDLSGLNSWSNPYVSSSGGGSQITMTASIRPLTQT